MMRCVITVFRSQLINCHLSFLLTVPFSEIYFLAVAIGSACALMIIIVIVVVLFQHFRKKRWADSADKAEGAKS